MGCMETRNFECARFYEVAFYARYLSLLVGAGYFICLYASISLLRINLILEVGANGIVVEVRRPLFKSERVYPCEVESISSASGQVT